MSGKPNCQRVLLRIKHILSSGAGLVIPVLEPLFPDCGLLEGIKGRGLFIDRIPFMI